MSPIPGEPEGGGTIVSLGSRSRGFAMESELLWGPPGRRNFGGNIHPQRSQGGDRRCWKIWGHCPQESTMPGWEVPSIRHLGISGLQVMV